MTISKELFLAILSMDAYNRGYWAGIVIEGDDASGGTTHIGGATISFNLEDADMVAPAQTAGFYAVAYTMGSSGDVPDELRGRTVIFYRGGDPAALGFWRTCQPPRRAVSRAAAASSGRRPRATSSEKRSISPHAGSRVSCDNRP